MTLTVREQSMYCIFVTAAFLRHDHHGTTKAGTLMRRPLLVALLAGTSLLHLLRPQTFEASIPALLPGSPRGWVRASGAGLAVIGVATAAPHTARWGGWAAAAFFAAVFPANVVMVRKARSAAVRRVLIARLPLQIPLIAWAVDVARTSP